MRENTSINLGLRGRYGWVVCGNALSGETQFAYRIGSFFNESPNGLERGVIRDVPPKATPVPVIASRMSSDASDLGEQQEPERMPTELTPPTIIEVPRWESLGPEVGTAIFLLLSWGALISCILLWRRYGFSFVKPLLAGGVAYTLGAIILGLNWPTLIPGVVGAHELWHVAVIAGLGLHWRLVFGFADSLPHAKVG
jgi:hypothetical protein